MKLHMQILLDIITTGYGSKSVCVLVAMVSVVIRTKIVVEQ